MRRAVKIKIESEERHLKRLSGKEQRFVRDVNHCISKKLANNGFDCYALEDLKKIPRNMGRRFNRKLGNWSFYQLENFLRYKAEELGKTVVQNATASPHSLEVGN